MTNLAGPRVRWAGADDWEALRSARLAALAEAPEAFTSLISREHAFPDDIWKARASEGNTVLAEDAAGAPIGLAGLFPDPDGLPRGELVGMWVAPSARGTGVAEALVDEIVTRSDTLGVALYLRVMSENARAIRFYLRTSFRFDGQPVRELPDGRWLIGMLRASEPAEAEPHIALAAALLDAGAPLPVDALTVNDLPDLGWSGSDHHMASVETALARGDVDYLAARAPGGWPVGKAGIDYSKAGDAGVIWQVAVHEALQGGGIGAALVAAAEACIGSRGKAFAQLSVEDDNRRARALYERLGYETIGTEVEEWDVRLADGSIGRHIAQCTVMSRGVTERR